MAQPTLADFQLIRSLRRNAVRADPNCLFLNLVVDKASNTDDKWTAYEIEDHEDVYPSSEAEFEYDISVQLGALIVRSAFLVHTSGVRFTKARSYQIIVDAWTAAGGTSARPLRFLAFENVVEEKSMAAMEKELRRQIAEGVLSNKDFSNGQAIVHTSSSENWPKNRWIGCCIRVAQSMSSTTHQVTVGRAWIMPPSRRGTASNLIVELITTAL